MAGVNLELECWIGTLIGWSELELADCLPRKLKWLEQLDASRLGTRIALSKFGVGLVPGWKAKLAVRVGKGFFCFLTLSDPPKNVLFYSKEVFCLPYSPLSIEPQP